MSTVSKAHDTTKPPEPVSFGEASRYWLKLGFISFGGPTGQISMMHQELVERRRWISEHRFLHALNYCMVLPGPEAQQLATYIGWLMHGTWGGIVAGALFVLPSLFVLIALTWVYLVFGNIPAVAGILYGFKPAVTAIVVFAAYRIGSRALKNAALWAVAAAAFVAFFAFNVPFPYIVLGAGIIGYIGGRIMPDKFRTGGHHGDGNKSYGSALIDDHTPPPEHARFKWTRVITYSMIALAIWTGVEGTLFALYGWQGTLTQMGWFFTKAALLTFGGAYAVLPYVYQGGVEQYQWLTGPQMIDGLALGETTPGPLIMVVAFVGFIGSWSKEVFGPDMLATAGIAGASVATYFTFLPSFLFILLGAPAVEATRGDIKFTSPLTGITAAVVGVILNLAVFFAYHVLWPQGIILPLSVQTLFGGFEWFSALIGVLAFIALWRFKIGIIPVILACGAAGLAFTLIKPLTGV
ncbi:chromate efflux transporter [Sulfuricaulis sp.]|jgi:chromate transporter|uniref:chromate efflux transporter n=1 Tax=Sulfuricaulis sp. TaxID=2003553 RepID=UPI00355A85D8